jgi:hypothetical protein
MSFLVSIFGHIILFIMSFLSLLLFDYEFKFFHLISFLKKTTEMLKLISKLKKENTKLIVELKSLENSTGICVETLKPLNLQSNESKKQN